MTIIFDTNVILDHLLARAPFGPAACWLVARVELRRLRGLLSATTVTTVYYLARKVHGERLARRQLAALLSVFEVAPVDEEALNRALLGGMADFEDAVLYESGLAAGADGLVTRDVRGFEASVLPVYSPEALQALIGSTP